MRIGSDARWAAAEGRPFPLGATWIEEEQAFNFALYSKHAESVELLLYGAGDVVFAPHNGYLVRRAAGSQHDEFRKMVDALHAAHIELVLDGFTTTPARATTRARPTATRAFREGDEFMQTQAGGESPLQSLRYRVAARSVAVLLRERSA